MEKLLRASPPLLREFFYWLLQEEAEKRIMEELGNGTSGSPSGRTRRQLRAAIRTVVKTMEPQAVLKSFPLEKQGAKILIDGRIPVRGGKIAYAMHHCTKAAVYAVSLGRKLDIVLRESQDADPAYGVILDQTASLAVERAARIIQETAAGNLPSGEGATERYSPGYCDWPLREQRPLFSLLGEETAGIELTESCMMIPGKSTSGIFGTGPAALVAKHGNACVFCAERGCPYRRGAF